MRWPGNIRELQEVAQHAVKTAFGNPANELISAGAAPTGDFVIQAADVRQVLNFDSSAPDRAHNHARDYR